MKWSNGMYGFYTVCVQKWLKLKTFTQYVCKNDWNLKLLHKQENVSLLWEINTPKWYISNTPFQKCKASQHLQHITALLTGIKLM